MAKKARLGKVKKKWFTAIAPKIYKSAEIGEITAYEPTDLIGRPVEVNIMQLTSSPKDQFKKAIFKITEIKGEKAFTAPWRFLLNESFIQRSSRRFKERIVQVLKLRSKDGKLMKYKLLILILKRKPRALRTAIQKKAEHFMTAKVAEYNSDELFSPEVMDKLVEELKKELKPIYPVQKILLWKLSTL